MTSRTLAVASLGLLLALSGRARAHEHMYIGSNAKNAGTVVLRYDFTRKFPLVPLPGTGQYISTDPAFTDQVSDDPASGSYRVKGGIAFTMRIVAMDPEVSIVFNGTTLRAPGDKKKIGTSPYLHQHPQWMLTLPPGVTGDYHFSFKVTASRLYKPSAVYTATLTNVSTETTTTTIVLPPGETTTTLAPCTPVICDDKDPCTDDVCDATGCHHTDSVAPDSVFCRLTKLNYALDGVRPQTRSTERARVKLYAIAGKAQKDVQVASGGGARTDKMLQKAAAQLNHFIAVVDKAVRKSALDIDTGNTLRTLSSDAYDQVVLMRSTGG